MLRNLTISLSRGEASAPAPAAAAAAGGNNVKTTRTYNTPSVAESSTVYDEPSADEDNDQEFEGYSSMTAHTAFASEFLEQAVTSTSLGHRLKPDIQNALATLQQMVHIQDRKRSWQESRFVHQKPIPKGGINQLPMPPTPVVVALLREMKDKKPATFMLNCAFIAVEDFIESCRKVYFATEDFSHAIFIIVNAGLYYLLQENAVTNEAMSEEYLRCHYICRDNLETALANLPLLMPAKMEMVEALLLGATYAIDISKFTIAWQLSNTAAAMCQTLGWHRLPVTEEESNDKKSAIFWFSYMLDKGLALRFGRSSAIQDWDISVPRRFGNIKVANPWKAVLNIWVRMAAMMGETYEQLYSPGALARSPEERTEIARLLIEKMKHLKKQTHELESDILRDEKESMQGDELRDKEWRMMTLEMVVKSDEVSNWALLTLLYRAIPGTGGSSGTFNEECVEAARMACKCHQECMELTSNSVFVTAGYVHWTILYMPFIPFIVLFCHAIETSNMDDVHRLGQFIVTLQPVIGISESIEKLHRLCQVLYKVATLYIEAKAQQQQDNDMTMVNNDFDMYLSQLGIMPQHSSLDSTGGDDQNMGAINPARLGDWFSGNRNILGLMEEDLSDFNPGVWSSVLGP